MERFSDTEIKWVKFLELLWNFCPIASHSDFLWNLCSPKANLFHYNHFCRMFIGLKRFGMVYWRWCFRGRPIPYSSNFKKFDCFEPESNRGHSYVEDSKLEFHQNFCDWVSRKKWRRTIIFPPSTPKGHLGIHRKKRSIFVVFEIFLACLNRMWRAYVSRYRTSVSWFKSLSSSLNKMQLIARKWHEI